MKGAPMTKRRPEPAFTALYRENYGRVLRFVERRVGDRTEAEDVTADIFRIAWDKATQGVTLSPGWLFVTAHHTVNNHYRATERAARLHRSVAADLAATAHTTVEQTTDAVHATLSDLAEQHRDILRFHYWDGLSAREIAAVLGISVSAVWVRLHRARRAFQDRFHATAGDHHG
jgi:RNA polymerase sigma-70 factor (ECF subfamily)